ncbi:hypothetical protein EZV73_01695 [Acidaminobacter sp. JC074]|uniref:hypothetical protein n=1 Tax=Acidaminobacter sp. JC074 TaxID=2530199 RepID=UPI001F113EC5|nr:hypothetical protein [Acidaminobacter sp. JC074]MCH4886258.1 hypothetical protein [Acidaminobacter sp. JC074]
MKKVIVLMVLLLCISSVYADQVEIGTVVNHVLSTDIKAFVNGHEIPSMNINGLTAIIVEDLRKYGFEVTWDSSQRRLSVSGEITNQVDPILVEKDSNTIGEVVADVLYTDIKTMINDLEVESFNIGGYTAIYIDALDQLGQVVWDENARKITFTPDKLSTSKRQSSLDINYGDYHTFKAKIIDDEIIYDEAKLGYIDRSNNGYKIYLSLENLYKAFAFTVEKDEDSYKLIKGDYTCIIDIDNGTYTEYYNGIQTRQEFVELHKKNDDLFIVDTDLILGARIYKDYMSEDISFSYQEYEVVDYDKYDIQGELLVLNIDEGQEMIRRNDTYLVPFYDYKNIPFNNTLNVYDELSYYIPLKETDNFELVILGNDHSGKDRRTIYVKSFKDLKPDYKSHVIDKEWPVGYYTFFSLNTPSEGYTETTSNEVVIDGEVRMFYDDYHAVNGDTFEVSIQKFNPIKEVFEQVNVQEVSYKDYHYNGTITLDGGQGLYRIIMTAGVDDSGGDNVDLEALRLFIHFTKL